MSPKLSTHSRKGPWEEPGHIKAGAENISPKVPWKGPLRKTKGSLGMVPGACESEASLGYMVNLMQDSQQPVLLLLHRREGGQTP